MYQNNVYVLFALILVFGVGLNELLMVVYGINHYSEGIDHVHTVLSMSKVPYVAWRALEHPLFSHIALISIKLAHAFSAIICIFSVLKLIGSIKTTRFLPVSFKNAATLGIGVACVLYFIGFSVIASNWFLIRMSMEMNPVPVAENIFFVYMFIILFINQQRKVEK